MTDQYKCQSYYDDNNVLQDCTCGKCEMQNEPQLSAEIRFEKIIGSVSRPTLGRDDIPTKTMVVHCLADDLKNAFREVLATALEEQRAKDIKIVETVISEWEEAGLPETQVALHDALGRLKEDTHAQ